MSDENKKYQNLVECIECGYEIKLPKNTEQGEIINCKDCDSELEVRAIKPYKLELAPEEEEDWGE